MMIRKLFAFVLILLAISVFNTCKKDSSSDNNNNNNNNDTTKTERDKVLADYKAIYLPTQTYTVGWTGNTASCVAGTVSADMQQKTLIRVNYFRKLAGLPGDITLNDVKNAKCQKGALMLHANGELNHTPPSTWKCYTQDGYDATSHSNISMGAVGPSAVSLFMQDPGSTNYICGHRRWILFPKLKEVGHGSTSSYACLYVIGDNKPAYPTDMPEFVSWPPKNYVPGPLVFNRWSFSIPGANFTNTSVLMTDSLNNNITLNIISRTDNGYGENTLVWEPSGIITNSSKDVTYNVKVNNVVVNSASKNYEYKVIIIKPTTKKKDDFDINNQIPPL